jgi:DNA anti-recombination protein RmuC
MQACKRSSPRDEERLAAWSDSLAALAAALRDEWAQTSAHAATRQQDICDTLARTANAITAQAQAHASDTINEISRLVQAASEAPKAAADVVAELRQRLSDSMVRDTAMLDERSRLLATLETLLGAVNHASTEQRTAIDALVSTSADLLERVGARFNDAVDAETRKLDSVAAQVTAVEVASLGDAFGAAVQVFGESNDKLLSHLQRIEAALEKSLARSDEQLEYYVAQAREVIDLSMMSQKQIVEDLQQIAGRRASVGA